MLQSLLKRCTAGVVTAGILAGSAALAAGPSLAAERASVEPGITKPSEQRDLSFNGPGLVREVNVKDGETVEADQVLAKQDDSLEIAARDIHLIEAKSDLEIDASKADLAVKKVQLERKEIIFKQEGRRTSSQELEEARLEVVLAEVRVNLARQKQSIAQATADAEQKKIDLKQLISPVKGVVQKLDTHVGEVASGDVREPAIRIVQNDPLWVEVNLATSLVNPLKDKQVLQVRYADEDKWVPATVIFRQPVANAASDTRLIRLQMPNPEGKPSGMNVLVKLREDLADATPVERKGSARAARAGAK